jgi:hypothetical protein
VRSAEEDPGERDGERTRQRGQNRPVVKPPRHELRLAVRNCGNAEPPSGGRATLAAVPDHLTEFIEREYRYLRRQEGRDFFLALRPYAEALNRKRHIRKIFASLEAEVQDAIASFADEQDAMIEEAKAIRVDLAERAPEIDNSNMERPENPLSDDWMTYDLDSFVRFDELANNDVEIRYSPLPNGEGDPGPVSRLLGILRGRLSAAEHGEDTPTAPKIRDDLDDLGLRIGNLSRRHEHALRRYRQDALTLPGLAFGRLVFFGSGLNPEPRIIESDEDFGRWVDEMLREWANPQAAVREFVNADRVDEGQRRRAAEIEARLKAELDRLHQELVRRLSGRRDVGALVRRNLSAVIVAAIGLIVGTLILVYVFGIGH